MAEQTILCRYCGESDVNFFAQLPLAYAPGVKEQILEMGKNAGGIRDTARVLQVNRNTVILAPTKPIANCWPYSLPE